jgi:hypothetical protein
MKYFVLSLHRTGTKSTIGFMSSLGVLGIHFPATHNGADLQQLVVGREAEPEFVAEVLSPVLEAYDSVADVPIPTLYPHLHERYPDAKYLLLHRNPSDWVRSVRSHTGRRPLRPFERVQYWHYFPGRPQSTNELSDQQLVGMCRRHVVEVIEFFNTRAPDRLGVFDLHSPQIGGEIARFVGSSARPEFPVINDKVVFGSGRFNMAH